MGGVGGTGIVMFISGFKFSMLIRPLNYILCVHKYGDFRAMASSAVISFICGELVLCFSFWFISKFPFSKEAEKLNDFPLWSVLIKTSKLFIALQLCW